MKILNKNLKSCPICQNKRVSEIVDELIISCEVRIEDLLINLESYNIYIDKDVLKEHWSHVFTMDEDDVLMKVLTIDPEASNLEAVKKTLAKIEIVENNMLMSGQEDNKVFLDLLKRKQEFLTLKSKLEGDLQEGITINVPEWITKVPMKVIDAEIVQPLLPKNDNI